MKEPTIEFEYPVRPEHWETIKPTKTGRQSNVDLTGMRFDKWLVLGPEKYHAGCGWYWNCRCDCGTEKPVSQRYLLEGASKSCGCNRRENMEKIRERGAGKHKKSRVDLIGRRFGRWTVIGKAGQEVGKHPVWRCRCDCGTIKDVSHSALVNGQSQSCGCLRSDLQMHIRYFGEYYPADADQKWPRNHKDH